MKMSFSRNLETTPISLEYFAAYVRNTTGVEWVVDGGNTIRLYPLILNK